jgi:hypothetical protein
MGVIRILTLEFEGYTEFENIQNAVILHLACHLTLRSHRNLFTHATPRIMS